MGQTVTAMKLLAAPFRHIRYGEVLLLQGAPFFGVAFSIGALTPARISVALVFAAASFLLVAHVFVFNDWADAAQGLAQRSHGRDARPTVLFWLSLFLLAASLAFFVFLPVRTLLLAMTIALLGIFYSHPRQNGKSRPIISSCIHFLGGLLHFLLGYALFSELDERGILLGLFCALTFTAGHLNQEVRDFEIDRASGARTNAVVFGKRRNFIASMVVFTLSYACLFLLSWLGYLPLYLAILGLVLYPVQMFWSARTLRNGLTSEQIRALQGRYRGLYALIGLAMLTTLFWK